MNLEQLRAYKPQILALAKEHGVGNVRVFGSVARGDADEASDVDLLVTPDEKTGIEFFRFCIDVENILHSKVDVVSDRAINRHMKDRILSEAIAL